MKYEEVLREAQDVQNTVSTVSASLNLQGARVPGLVAAAYRAGFNEACDRMGIPEAATPMERIALAGGSVK